jgi:hypothetical protein
MGAGLMGRSSLLEFLLTETPYKYMDTRKKEETILVRINYKIKYHTNFLIMLMYIHALLNSSKMKGSADSSRSLLSPSNNSSMK